MKNKNLILALSALLLGTFLCWMVWSQFIASSAVREFHHLLADSKQEVFNLKDLKNAEWDEVAFWGVNHDICDLGIKGYELGSKNCRTITNERECYVLLLKEAKLVSEIPVNRRMFDFVKSNIPLKLAKEQAAFRFVTKGDFPTIEVVPTP
jgi:hypothetical protein